MHAHRSHRLLPVLTALAVTTPLACNTPEEDEGFSSTSLGETTGDGDGDASTTDATTTDATTTGEVPPDCGDGNVDPGEECDLGADNDDSGQCTSLCTIATCGDGFVFDGFEECDDGNTLNSDECTGVCSVAVCGDGYVHAGVEACDDANDDETDGCTSYCLPTYCGDGIVQEGEQCDDGNMTTTDACPACQFAFCGDGFLQAGVEVCDDGNTDPNDGCTAPLCQLASCGDGIVWEGMETCDDGNLEDSDACPTTCEPATCGDGYVQIGVEECDDQNEVDDDFCQNECISNGFIDDFETNDLMQLPWVTSGNANWFTTDADANGGMYSAVNGDIGNSQQSHLDLEVFAPSDGLVSFSYKTSTEGCCDRLRFYVDNVELDNWAGNQDWAQAEFLLTPGMHSLRWSYTKDGSVHSFLDSVWIDDIYIGGPLPMP